MIAGSFVNGEGFFPVFMKRCKEESDGRRSCWGAINQKPRFSYSPSNSNWLFVVRINMLAPFLLGKKWDKIICKLLSRFDCGHKQKLFLMQFFLLMVCGTVDSEHIADQTIRRPTCSTLLSIRQADQPMNIFRQEFVPRVLCIIFVILIIAHNVQHTPIFVTTPTNGSR